MADTTRPLPPGLLPSDEWLIQMLLEGRVDADIGGELGLSAGEVRERVAAVASKLNVNGREGIRRYFGVEPAEPLGSAAGGARKAPYPVRGVLVAILVLAAAGTVAAVALSRGSGEGPAKADASAEEQAAVAAELSATAAAKISAENPGGWTDAGPLFFVDGTTQPVVNSSVRALYTVVTLAGPGLIKLDAGNVKWSAHDDVGGIMQAELTGIINGVWESVFIRTDDNTRLLPDSQESVRFFAVNSAPNPVLLVSANPLGSGPPHQSVVGADGRLLLDPKPVPNDAVINRDTGEALDVSKATALSVNFASGGGSTRCGGGLSDDDGGRCATYWLGVDPLLAPADGTLECGVAGTWALVTPAFVLHFAGTDGIPAGTGARVPCNLSAPRPLKRGVGQIGDSGTSFVITATTNNTTLGPDNQNRLSVAIGGSTLYVGPIYLKVGCPCLGGS